MKGSYRLGRLLKRFIPNGFGDTFQEPEISDPGRQQSESHYENNRQAPILKSKDPFSTAKTESDKQNYLAYQKAVQAGKVAHADQHLKSPGKILKLPRDEGGE